MRLRYLPGIRDDLQALPPSARRKLKASLEALAVDRDDPSLDAKRLRGDFRRPLGRLAVGNWRAVFYQDGDDLYVVRVVPRRQGYDWLTEWTA